MINENSEMWRQLNALKPLLGSSELEFRARGLVEEPFRQHWNLLLDLMLSIRGNRKEAWDIDNTNGGENPCLGRHSHGSSLPASLR